VKKIWKRKLILYLHTVRCTEIKKEFEWEWQYKKYNHDRLLPVIAGVPQGSIGQQLQGVGIPALQDVFISWLVAI
jgi:hypothetical protein